MKKTMLYLSLVLTAMIGYAHPDGMISEVERRFLLDFIDLTEENLVATINQFDTESWTYRPKDGGWTPEECMTHILLAEQGVFAGVQKALAGPANDTLVTRQEDAWLIGKVNDRGIKVITPLPMEVTGATKGEMIQSLKDSRAKIREFLEQDDLPLRNHFGRSPYGPADAYQLFLVIASHSMRHTHQMTEVLNELESL